MASESLDKSGTIVYDATDKVLGRKRLDLLALEQIVPDENKYGFLVIEVKLGTNPELRKDVANQLDGYVNHIKKHIKDYISCYQTQYLQKELMEVIKPLQFNKISIVEKVNGLVVVGGYSKLASQSTL